MTSRENFPKVSWTYHHKRGDGYFQAWNWCVSAYFGLKMTWLSFLEEDECADEGRTRWDSDSQWKVSICLLRTRMGWMTPAELFKSLWLKFCHTPAPYTLHLKRYIIFSHLVRNFIPTGSFDWPPLVVCPCFYQWVPTRDAETSVNLITVRNYGDVSVSAANSTDWWTSPDYYSPPRVHRYTCGQIRSTSDSRNRKCCWDIGCKWHVLLWCLPLPNHPRPEVSGFPPS